MFSSFQNIHCFTYKFLLFNYLISGLTITYTLSKKYFYTINLFECFKYDKFLANLSLVFTKGKEAPSENCFFFRYINLPASDFWQDHGP